LVKPKALQVEEDKVLAEVIVSVIYLIMPLTRKDIGEGIGYPTRPSQLKGNFLGLERRVLRESKTLLCLEGELSRMLTTWLKDESPSKRRVGLTRA